MNPAKQLSQQGKAGLTVVVEMPWEAVVEGLKALQGRQHMNQPGNADVLIVMRRAARRCTQVSTKLSCRATRQ